MGKNIKPQIAKSARKRGLKGKRYNAYVYDTIHKVVKRTRARKRK